MCAWSGGGPFSIPIVFLTFFRVAQHGVGFGDLHETFGCGRVMGIVIRMMGFGECIEFPESHQPMPTAGI